MSLLRSELVLGSSLIHLMPFWNTTKLTGGVLGRERLPEYRPEVWSTAVTTVSALLLLRKARK